MMLLLKDERSLSGGDNHIELYVLSGGGDAKTS